MTPTASREALAIACAHCQTPLRPDIWNSPDPSVCSGCHAPVTALVFPALWARPPVTLAQRAEEGEAACFYHPTKKAVVPCAHCGRFLCALCSVDFLNQNWCPNCIDAGRKRGRFSNLVTHRMLYDNAALILATLPLVVWPLTILTAPLSLFVAIRYWHAPFGLVRRTRLRFYLAVIFAVVELGAWGWLGAFLVSRL